MCLSDWGQCYKMPLHIKSYIWRIVLSTQIDCCSQILSRHESKKCNQLVFNEEKATLCDGAVPCPRPVQLVIFLSFLAFVIWRAAFANTIIYFTCPYFRPFFPLLLWEKNLIPWSLLWQLPKSIEAVRFNLSFMFLFLFCTTFIHYTLLW